MTVVSLLGGCLPSLSPRLCRAVERVPILRTRYDHRSHDGHSHDRASCCTHREHTCGLAHCYKCVRDLGQRPCLEISDALEDFHLDQRLESPSDSDGHLITESSVCYACGAVGSQDSGGQAVISPLTPAQPSQAVHDLSTATSLPSLYTTGDHSSSRNPTLSTLLYSPYHSIPLTDDVHAHTLTPILPPLLLFFSHMPRLYCVDPIHKGKRNVTKLTTLYAGLVTHSDWKVPESNTQGYEARQCSLCRGTRLKLGHNPRCRQPQPPQQPPPAASPIESKDDEEVRGQEEEHHQQAFDDDEPTSHRPPPPHEQPPSQSAIPATQPTSSSQAAARHPSLLSSCLPVIVRPFGISLTDQSFAPDSPPRRPFSPTTSPSNDPAVTHFTLPPRREPLRPINWPALTSTRPVRTRQSNER